MKQDIAQDLFLISSFRVVFTLPMEFNMIGMIINKFKIFYSIVRGVTVYMVDNLFLFQISTNMLFHYKPVFHNIPLAISKWMGFAQDSNISVASFYTSTFPKRIIRSTALAFSALTHFVFRFFCMFCRMVWRQASKTFVPCNLSAFRSFVPRYGTFFELCFHKGIIP